MAEAPAARVQETTQVLEAQQVRAAAPAVHLQLMMNSNSNVDAGNQPNREQAAVCNDRCAAPARPSRPRVPWPRRAPGARAARLRPAVRARVDAAPRRSDDVNMEQLWPKLWDDPSPCATQYGAILENLDAIKTSSAPPAGIMQGATRIDKLVLEGPPPEEVRAAEMVRQHPVFEKLVRAHYSCRKVGSRRHRRAPELPARAARRRGA